MFFSILAVLSVKKLNVNNTERNMRRKQTIVFKRLGKIQFVSIILPSIKWKFKIKKTQFPLQPGPGNK